MSSLKLSDYFSKADHQRAAELITQQERYFNLSKIELDKGEFDKAALYSNHATAIAVEIHRMHKQKLTTDDALDILKQIKHRELADQMMDRKKWF
ncbi:hypothetical protein [Paraliobacillus sp. X-1268]|uniref:hypothetical protein n=1 Tax=Paraliobacillus sp. X-1268 TaxID=2213193 RepID=UPI001300A091|nr:hypothetical protein [Paraliobacillus sp. X-1268]